jgi:4-hydroxy-3-polyprenylbenzoate decarboxylase
MAFNDLPEFVRALEKAGELKRILFEVDPYLEVTEFADRSVKRGGPALLFEKPKGSNVPLLINAFASMRRMELALGADKIDDIAERIAGYLQMEKPEGLLDKLKLLPKLGELNAAFPKKVSDGPCKEVIRRTDFSLDEFPILHCWPFHHASYGLHP